MRVCGVHLDPEGHVSRPRQYEKLAWRDMDLSDTAYKVYGPKKPLLKLMNLTETSSQVNGPLVHLTLD